MRSSGRIASVNTTFGPIESGMLYQANWTVSAKVRGPLRFCVTAFDRAGNRSAESCGKLTLR